MRDEMTKQVLDLKQKMQNKVDTSVLIERSLSDWRAILAEECQVYVYNENYIAKRFDHINYKFCSKNEAKEVLIDNIYALLRFKYFPTPSEEVDDRIDAIVRSFTANLKSTLKRVSFKSDTNSKIIQTLPNYCCAFRNGVYDFKNDKWLFKYTIITIESLSNIIYLYDTNYAILWYLDYDFTPLPVNISKTSLDDFIALMKEMCKTSHNYCFELMYNIAHNAIDQFDMKRFMHLCEILGYTMYQSLSQHFVMLVGSGGNGKNSLFDGCFTDRVAPSATAQDLNAIENNNFITGALENHYHNIFLETSTKDDTYSESMMLKALTGSTTQSIHHKGVDAYTGYLNLKYIFSANDQDKIKFQDTTQGFIRRINVYEIWFAWDAQKRFLKRGDYYDTSFSDDLHEIKDDLTNSIAFVYFAMYGIQHATQNFEKNFTFSKNDWKMSYSNIDLDMKEKIEKVNPTMLLKFMKSSKRNNELSKVLFFDTNKDRLYLSSTFTELGFSGFDDLERFIEDDEVFTNYFSNHDVYISVRQLQEICGDLSSPTSFTQTLKKLYGIQFVMLASNKPYMKVTFSNNRMKVIR